MYVFGKVFPSNTFLTACGHYSWCVTLIFAGIILYQIKTGVFSKRFGTTLLAMNYALTLAGLYFFDNRYLENEPYLISFIYALFLFIMLPKLELKQNRVIYFLADISFSVYLLHMTVGGLVMSLFENKIRYTFSLCISLSTVILISILFCFFIERPIRKLLRKL